MWPHMALRKMHSDEDVKKLQLWINLSKSCGWWEPFENIVFVCERPLTQTIDSQGNLHDTSKPALLCRDGWPVYAVHGVRVPADIIEDKNTLTVQRIEQETNAEIRRVMIDLYGPKKYTADSGAILIQEMNTDHPIKGLRTAKLFLKKVPNDEDIIILDVLNSSPEPDGSYKRYQLRIDPNAYNGEAAKNCHAALASTWRTRLNGPLMYPNYQDYNPSFES